MSAATPDDGHQDRRGNAGRGGKPGHGRGDRGYGRHGEGEPHKGGRGGHRSVGAGRDERSGFRGSERDRYSRGGGFRSASGRSGGERADQDRGHQRDDRPRRDFDRGERPRRDFDRGERPRRDFGRDERDRDRFADDQVAAPRPGRDAPVLEADITADELDPQVRAELVSLARPVADTVSRHLVAAGRYLDEEPALALEHALAARRLASRIGVVREAVGLAAYHAGEWQTAVSELRTYHRMSGKQTHLAVLADCERALGRPERAIDLYRTVERKSANTSEAIELLIVAAGARADMGQNDASVAMLQVRELTADAPWVGRLRYAYADALLSVGRRDEAREWFARAVDADPEGGTDAAERLLDLDGITLESDDEGDPELALLMAHEELGERTATEAPAQGAEATAGETGAQAASPGADEGDDLDDDELDDDELDDDSFDDVDDLDDDDDLDVDDDDDLDEGFVDDEDADEDLDDDLDDDDLDDDELDDDEDLDDEDDWDLYVPPSGEPASGDTTRDQRPGGA